MLKIYTKKSVFTLLIAILGLGVAEHANAQTPCGDLYFSEYLEGASGNNKAYEIYNPTSNPITLDNYSVKLFVNGAATSSTVFTFPTGTTISAGGVVIVAHTSQTYFTNTTGFFLTTTTTTFNGDDALALFRGTDTLDIIGNIGCDPGAEWITGTKSTKDRVLRRKATINRGVLADPGNSTCDFPTLDAEWDDFVDTDVTGFGTHTQNPCGGTPTGCTDLFISEYIEGSSSNKAIEIYNPTNQAINLSNYRLELFSNGSTTASNPLALSGMLASGDVYLIANPSADPAILALADTTHSITFFNGDDAFALFNGTDTLDIFGVIGVDPGSSWPVDTGATVNYTLVRKSTVTEGQKNWTVGATEWTVYAQDNFSFLGGHTSTCISAPTAPIVAFASASSTVAESAGTATITLNIANPSATDTIAVNVRIGASSTASPATDYTFTDTVVVWQANDNAPKVITVNIFDDSAIESDETIVFTLANPTNGAVLGAATHTLTITDNDAPAPVIPIYTISQITGLDANFEPDSNGVMVGVRGIILGSNTRGSNGYQFTIHDYVDGIGLFRTSNITGLTLTEGDSVIAYGTVGHFNGLTQINMDSATVLGTNKPLPAADTVTVLSEATESELITIANPLTLAPGATWNLTGGGVTIEVTDGTNTYDMRIDGDTDIYGNNMPAPTGPFYLTGIGGQFDSSIPRDGGYQILPRYMADFNFSVGVKEKLDVSAISVYPNPTKDQLTVNLGENTAANTQLVILNTLGQVVKTADMNSTETTVNVASLPAGVYMIRITSNNNIAVKQFIKAN